MMNIGGTFGMMLVTVVFCLTTRIVCFKKDCAHKGGFALT